MNQTTKIGLKPILLLTLMLFSFALICPGEGLPDHKFMVTASGNLFFSSAAGYRQIYGQAAFMPEIKIARSVFRNISIWGGCGWIAQQGYIEEINEPAQIRQTIISFGAGYVHRLNDKLQLRAEAGMTFNQFKEEALDETMKGSGLGWKIGANLDCFIWKKVFAILSTSFNQASDEAQTGKIKLGGFQLGAGLGLAF